MRSIAAHSGRKSISFYANSVEEFIENFEFVDGFIVVKCHIMDRRFFDLAGILGAKIIVSTRDPRDCAVSLFERFDLDLKNIVNDLANSYSSILSINSNFKTLIMRYGIENAFDSNSVEKIAEFIECYYNKLTIDTISTEFSYKNIAERIKGITSIGDPLLYYEPDTHWHPNHVGDGQTGKWRDRFNPIYVRAVEGAILPMHEAEQLDGISLFLSPLLFHHDADYENLEKIELVCDGTGRHLLWGPYFYLPSGVWIAEYSIESGDNDLTIKIDVHQPIESRGTLSVKTLELRGNLISDQKIEFVHMEQSYPLEFRISAVSDGHKGSFTFHGVKLTRSGDSPRKKMNNANHIRPC